jgi:hypothetical protein
MPTEDTLAQLDPSSAGSMDQQGPQAQGPQGPMAPDKGAEAPLWKEFPPRIEACKQYRKKLIANWTTNIDYRRGKPFASQTDEDRVAVNLDWSLTKAKQAALFSQVPQVHVDHPPQTVAMPWVFTFEQKLNDTLVEAGLETAMDEVLPDVINAAGIGAVLVSFETITEQVQVPGVDFSQMPPEMAQQIQMSGMMPDGSPIPPPSMVPRIADKRYVVQRISPSDLLWPINFTGADFDNAPWIGHSGRMSWAQAQSAFGLTDADKAKVVGEDAKGLQDKLTHDVEKDKIGVDEDVLFDEIFYKEYYYDSAAKNYNGLHRLVFVAGKDKPVVDEPWNGQRTGQTGEVIGARKAPVRVLTLTYITDETIPPSDTAIGRSQVNEINKSRTQMIMQRERSLPIRWFDVNRIDPTIQTSLMRGTWQGMIPVQGQGTNVIGEVARATMPQEDFEFDRIAKADLTEAWQIGPNQNGDFNPGRRSASEARVVESNFQTRIGRERAKVAKFVVSIAEVLGGLLAINEDPQGMGQGFDPQISRNLAFSILADSTVLVDANQRLERLKDFLNFTAKSGWVDLQPVLREIAILSGLDPNSVIKPPQPPPPAEPNISLRLTGTEDMLNPLTLAMMIKSGQAPDSQTIEQAKQLIAQAVTPPPGMMPGGPAAQMMPVGPDGKPLMPGQMALPTPQGLQPGAPMPQVQTPPPPAPPVGSANPNMTLMSKIDKRADQA